VPDAVGQDDEILLSTQRLTVSEQYSAKFVGQKSQTRSTRAVHDQDGITHDPRVISDGCSERSVMQLEFRHGFAAFELKVGQREIMFIRCWIVFSSCFHVVDLGLHVLDELLTLLQQFVTANIPLEIL
jgi:hypothetical protein